MNEAETRAEHIDPALKAAGLRASSLSCAGFLWRKSDARLL